MQFRPCIDIHNGKVKQIVGGTLQDKGDFARENFCSEKDASYFAEIYRQRKIKGGHVILLNKEGSPFFEETKRQAFLALQTYPKGLQAGGGVRAENAAEYLDAGASHVIVTSYIFRDGKIYYENLEKMVREVGKEHLVLDLSCRKKDGQYFIVTDRWQNYTDVALTKETLHFFENYCDEFLIHAVDVEGKAEGIETDVVKLLGREVSIPCTYAGGVHSYADLHILKKEGHGRINVTIGSALALFGGNLNLDRVLKEIEDL